MVVAALVALVKPQAQEVQTVQVAVVPQQALIQHGLQQQPQELQEHTRVGQVEEAMTVTLV